MLVATSVAEEGLDIRQCNVVIRFDLAKTVLAYIQSRGRARKPGSDYILMVERYGYGFVICWHFLFNVVVQICFSRALVSPRELDPLWEGIYYIWPLGFFPFSA